MVAYDVVLEEDQEAPVHLAGGDDDDGYDAYVDAAV